MDNELSKMLKINEALQIEADFVIEPNGKISESFLKNGILTFCQSTTFIQNLPY